MLLKEIPLIQEQFQTIVEVNSTNSGVTEDQYNTKVQSRPFLPPPSKKRQFETASSVMINVLLR